MFDACARRAQKETLSGERSSASRGGGGCCGGPRFKALPLRVEKVSPARWRRVKQDHIVVMVNVGIVALDVSRFVRGRSTSDTARSQCQESSVCPSLCASRARWARGRLSGSVSALFRSQAFCCIRHKDHMRLLWPTVRAHGWARGPGSRTLAGLLSCTRSNALECTGDGRVCHARLATGSASSLCRFQVIAVIAITHGTLALSLACVWSWVGACNLCERTATLECMCSPPAIVRGWRAVCCPLHQAVERRPCDAGPITAPHVNAIGVNLIMEAVVYADGRAGRVVDALACL